MKKIVLPIILGIVTSICYSQDIAIQKKFITTEYIRVGAALGVDASWAGENGKTGLISQNGNIGKDNLSFNTSPNTTVNLGLDIYSPTSIVGLYTGVDINFQKYSVSDETSTIKDSISTTNIEIPLYLKLRFGSVRSKGQVWLALGGGYSLTTKAETIVETGFTQVSIDSKDQFASIPYLSGIVGYEFLLGSGKEEETYNRDMFRILVFAKANYDLGNRLEPSQSIPNTSINTYQDPSIEYLRISLGVRVLLRLSKAGQLIGETMKNQLIK